MRVTLQLSQFPRAKLNQTHGVTGQEKEAELFPNLQWTFYKQLQEARQHYIDNEKKAYENQIQDLKQCLAINKEMMSAMFASTPNLNQALITKLNNENVTLMEKMYKLSDEKMEALREVLLAKQVELQSEGQRRDETLNLYRRIDELKDNLSRKELFLQQKEKKWNEIELSLMPYADTMPEVYELLSEAKLLNQGLKTIQNVITANERLQVKIYRLQKNYKRIKEVLLNPKIVKTLTTKLIQDDDSFGSGSESSTEYEKNKNEKKDNYIAKLEQSLARAHILLDEKYYDLRQIRRAHQSEISLSLELQNTLASVQKQFQSLIAQSEETQEGTICEHCMSHSQIETIQQLLEQAQSAPSIQQEVSKQKENYDSCESSGSDWENEKPQIKRQLISPRYFLKQAKMPELRISSIRMRSSLNYREMIKEAQDGGVRMYIEDFNILHGTQYDCWGLNNDVDFSF